VASVAAGKYHGVASKANLVVVKIKNAAINPGNPGSGFKGRGVTDSAIDYAFQYVIDDVARQRKDNPNMKFVVNLSYGKLSLPPNANALE
jgi:hypothetical protein